jgi:hypothetical protein
MLNCSTQISKLGIIERTEVSPLLGLPWQQYAMECINLLLCYGEMLHVGEVTLQYLRFQGG